MDDEKIVEANEAAKTEEALRKAQDGELKDQDLDHVAGGTGSGGYNPNSLKTKVHPV